MESEQDKQAPETVDVDEAVSLMDGPEPEPAEAPDDAPEPTESAGPESASDDDPAPEFWSAEDKAAWTSVPAELRPLLKKYEQQRVEFVNEKAREAAAMRAKAAAEIAEANTTADQSAAWWQQAGPALQRAFADKWGQVKWAELAEKDPKEWARLNQQRLDEAALLTEAQRRGHAEIQAAQQRAQERFQHARNTEQLRLAERLPDWFGTPDAAEKTYRELGNFLLSKGIAPDRINAIYEAPIIELALSAWRFEQAQQAALRSSARAKEGNVAARPTPTRVAPGPASRTGNRESDTARQVGERFRRGGGASIADAAELIRLSGL
jgi:hypothetical protein